jgi:hypothetical protein
MKPLIITLLALPIVGMLHHYSELPQPKPTVALITNVSKQTSLSKITPPKAITAAKVTQTPTAPVKPPSAPVVAPTVPAPVVYASGCSNYEPTFAQYGWNVSVAMAICEAESSGNPNAVSQTNDYGLMQIHDGLALYGDKIYDPYFNISIAYIKYQTQGWEAWSTYLNGAYLKYEN